MMFSVPLTCCEDRDVLLLTRVQPRQRDMASCDFSFTGSKDVLCIQPSVLELSANGNMCETFTNFRIVMYIDIDDARNSNRFSMIFPCYSDGILHRHVKPLPI